MAYERGLFNKPDLNDLQERLLSMTIVQNKLEEFKKTEDEFERLLMIHRPEVWQKIQEEREEAEEMGFDEIVWRSPESIEEFEEIEKTLREFEESHQMVTVSKDIPNSSTVVAPIFNGIDLGELGEDD